LFKIVQIDNFFGQNAKSCLLTGCLVWEN